MHWLVTKFDIVTKMECRFPSILVLWLGREFYKGMYGNSGGIEPPNLDLDDEISVHLDEQFGDFAGEMWDLKSTGIFSISLLGAEIQIYPDDSM
ncbi:hypothetical protein AVEN_111257-1 [Araneus ventricosus]|uniref:Uncharacterized protein n=1 Tax=Araneus ventricosus TaxID=182803 RepID=A0A4Y2P2K8_ARAVE|nr:hypothetical protein AVEN_111257-1 [Araneus ventricosus]